MTAADAASSATTRCSRCKTVKPLVEFSKHPTSYNGRQSRCKACFKTAAAPEADADGGYIFTRSDIREMAEAVMRHAKLGRAADAAGPLDPVNRPFTKGRGDV